VTVLAQQAAQCVDSRNPRRLPLGPDAGEGLHRLLLDGFHRHRVDFGTTSGFE
jgi:hypothetical protein